MRTVAGARTARGIDGAVAIGVIAGLLLAAGQSRRFGSPKLLEDLGGRPVIVRSAELLLAAGIEDILIVVGTDHEAIRGALRRAGVKPRYVVNPHPDRGIGLSIARGVGEIGPDADAIAISLADEPLLAPAAVKAVVRRYNEGGVAIVAPRYLGGVPGHPVVFDRSIFEELMALTGDHGARSVVTRAPARVAILDVDDEPPADLDTPADLAQLRIRAQNKRSPTTQDS